MSNDHRPLIDEARLDDLEPSAELALLRHALEVRRPSPERQVFVNRTLRLEKIRHVGFDLDWTLADYSRDPMSQLAFELTLDRLVERFDYPRAILDAEFRSNFCRRGLILDTEHGTVLKMNRHRYVGRAYHGRQFLGPKERGDLYRREPVNPSANRFYMVDTLFELPEVNIFSEVVDIARRHPDRLSLDGYGKLFSDTREAIDSLHADGRLKERILGDLDRYLQPDPELALALERLRLDNRRLLLITNSEWYFTDGICRHLFGNTLPGLDDWRDLFDLVIVSAGKPGFFRKQRPFVRLDDTGQPIDEVDVPDWGGVYLGGCREGLMQLLDVPGEQVLYIGDHIYGDILSSKIASTWRTALVVSELEDEMRVRHQLASQLRHMDVLRAELTELGLQTDDLSDVLELYRRLTGSSSDAKPRGHRKQEQERRHNGGPAEMSTHAVNAQLRQLRDEHKAMRKHAARLQSRISKTINPYWGSLFKQGSNKSYFGSQVDDFACVYTSAVRNFAYYGGRHYFRVTSDPMMHEVEI
ncbi:MAG: HAD-IG family 5'-nucleotidase [Acidobacteriota bacterium]